MKKLNIKIFLIIALFWVSTGCNDEFLDKFPETSIGTENFFKTEADLKMYVYSMYNFPSVGNYVADAATDNAATTGNTELKTMMISNPSSATITGGWTWSELRNINLFLENFNNANIDQALLNHYEGLGRFFRARFYIDKVKRFSDVPWYDEVIDTDETELLFKGRDTREFVVGKIMEDLEFAAANVMESVESGEVNEWVVKSYLARFALYEGTMRKYHTELGLSGSADGFLQTARDVSKDIMDSGNFSIHSDYSELFTSTSLNGNSEVIFARYYENETLNSGWWSYMFGDYEVCPSKDLLQSYLLDDGSFYTDQVGYDTKEFVEEFQNRDPRLSQTYAYPGWLKYNSDTYSQGNELYVQKLAKNFSGYHQIKGFMNTNDQEVFNSVDFPVIRFAETLLIYAEARAELAELTQSDLDLTVNQLRSRVSMPAMSMAPAVDPVQEARYPAVQSATSQWAELLEIRRERRVELALEGYREDDLMRWSAGKLLEKEVEGLYFPGLGQYDLTGDGVVDIELIDAAATVPEPKAQNSLGVDLIYFKAGTFGESVDVYLENTTSGKVQTTQDRGTFEEPKFYYRPIPETHVVINPNLKQIFGWN